MSLVRDELPPELVRAKLNDLLVTGAIFFGVFLSGFVIVEPAPYDLAMAGFIGLAFVLGLRISRTVAPLLILLALLFAGGLVSMTQMADIENTPLYLAITLFLSMTAVFFAAAIEARPALYSVICLGWLAAAIGTGTLGILGYFGAFPGELFTLYSRAAGAFKDPNVFGPFLVFPTIFVLHRLMTGNPLRMPLYVLALLFLIFAILLSFSRGAWGLLAVTTLMLTFALFVQSASGRFRLRIAAMSLMGGMLLVLAIIVALQIPAVGDLFSERAQLVQDYDGGRHGRFDRFRIGFAMAMEHPLGIGPLVFGKLLGEDTHNIWLKTLMDYSWLGFAAFLTLVVWTVAGGFRILFRDRPWQPYLLCAWIVFIGTVALGTVIDINHWRHVYVLLGMIWGAMALEARHQRRERALLRTA